MYDSTTALELKFCRFDEALTVKEDGMVIEGYASRFGAADQGGDVVEKGPYTGSLGRLAAEGRSVKMLWQHDPREPIGVWDVLREDDMGLWVKGRLLDSVTRGREAAALIQAGAIDGLSIGYRTQRSAKDAKGRRLLTELDLWEVSLVTFPMLPSAQVSRAGSDVSAKGHWPFEADLRDLAEAFHQARVEMGDR